MFVNKHQLIFIQQSSYVSELCATTVCNSMAHGSLWHTSPRAYVGANREVQDRDRDRERGVRQGCLISPKRFIQKAHLEKQTHYLA